MGRSSRKRAAARAWTLADVKADLTQFGQTLHPKATVKTVTRPTGQTNIIILDRVVKNALPDYCVHGYASCIRCDHMCWLGHETEKVVASLEASAICLDCANELHAAGLLPLDKATTHVQDHLRADGPHG